MTKNLTISHSDLDTKKRKLEEIRTHLKTEFFGIDKCIDSIMDSIQTWYLLPQVIVRPVIINLFGQTGTGKTSLVRSLVNHLNLTSKFIEIQMDGFSSSGSSEIKTISGLLNISGIDEGQPGIILLDEFQRFRTVDGKGEDIRLERYPDVWMLLSDGKFPSDYTKLETIIEYMNAQDYYDDYYTHQKEEEAARDDSCKSSSSNPSQKITYKQDIKYKRRFLLTHNEAENIKKMLRLSASIREIMTWEKVKIRGMIEKHITENKDRPYDYTKCLIFVSGNLDEAFKMAESVEDCDTSADVFHSYTLKIGVPEIKAALSTRFRPEQIARLGNNHVIYPSLSSSAYMSLIRRTCLQYVEQTNSICGVSFTVDENVYQEIYDNSVYPTQGTRPVFTSIHKLFGSPLSDGILWALENNYSDINISLDIPNSSLVFNHKETKNNKKIKLDFEIRARRKSRSDDFKALVAVHEAGHAIVYAALFKRPPVEIAINVASFKGGYNIFKDTFLCKSEVLDRIATLMAGIAAEEAIFGQDLRSTGCGADVGAATSNASMYVRNWAMDGVHGLVVPENCFTLNDINRTDPMVEIIIKNQLERAQSIMTEYRSLLLDLSHELIKASKMDANSFVKFVNGRISGLIVSNEEKDVNSDYAARLARATTPVSPNEEDRKIMSDWVKRGLDYPVNLVESRGS